MEGKVSYKKRITAYMTVALTAFTVFSMVSNSVLLKIIGSGEIINSQKVNWILSSVTCASNLLVALITFALGWLLTKDKVKTVRFAGAAFFGKSVGNLFSSFFTCFGQLAVDFGSLRAETISIVILVVNLALIPFNVFVACQAFTAFDNINKKFLGKGFSSFKMNLSKARILFFVASLVSSIASVCLLSIPSMIMAFSENSFAGTFEIALSNLASWVSVVIPFAFIYFAGYIPGKNHVEAMAFYSASAVGNICTSILMSASSLVIIPLSSLINKMFYNEVLNSVLGNAFNKYFSSYIATLMSSPFSVAVSFLVALYFMKFFFSKEVVSQEAQPEESYQTEKSE